MLRLDVLPEGYNMYPLINGIHVVQILIKPWFWASQIRTSFGGAFAISYPVTLLLQPPPWLLPNPMMTTTVIPLLTSTLNMSPATMLSKNDEIIAQALQEELSQIALAEASRPSSIADNRSAILTQEWILPRIVHVAAAGKGGKKRENTLHPLLRQTLEHLC
jgi:hypothetical protein